MLWSVLKQNTEIENTRGARMAPTGKYRLLWTGRTGKHPGLYYLKEFSRAQLAIDAASELGFCGGNAIVENDKGLILTLNDGGARMYSAKELLSTFGGGHHQSSVREFTQEYVQAIVALQLKRLPVWKPGDQL